MVFKDNAEMIQFLRGKLKFVEPQVAKKKKKKKVKKDAVQSE